MKGDTGFPVRVRFTKRGKVRFVGHRDVARAFERAFRIEQLPLSFTLGFSPRPKVSFGLALGVGHESLAEYLDVELAQPVDVEALVPALSAALPEGIDVSGTAALSDRAPALQEAVTSVQFQLMIADAPEALLRSVIEQALDADTLPVTTTRKGRDVVEDLRPALRRLAVTSDDTPGPVVTAEVSTRPRGVRPADLLTALRDLAATGADDGRDRVLRTHQWIERDGARLEPLEADRAVHMATSVCTTSKGLTDDRRDQAGGNRLQDHPHAGTKAGIEGGTQADQPDPSNGSGRVGALLERR
jgi:radical SAM-linked protein